MNMLKRMTASALAIVMALSALSGCGGGGSSSSGSGSSSSSSSSSSSTQAEGMDLTGVTDPYLATAGVAGDEVVAKVGDTDVTAAELLYWVHYGIEYQLAQYGGYLTDLPWDTDIGDGTTLADQMKKDALDAAAFYALVPVLAEKEGLSVPQETLDEMNSQHQQIVEMLGSEEVAEHYYWSRMLTRQLLEQQNQRGDLHLQLQDLYFGEGSGSYPTDAEVLAYIEDELGYFRTKHILLMTVDSSYQPLDDETIAQKRALAEDLLAQIRSADDPIATFDQLMNEYSEDPGLASNPDGYEFSATDSLVDGYREAALALEVGEISDIVETDYGYHIMLRLPLDPDQYRGYLVAQRMQGKIDALLEEYGVETTDVYDKIDLPSFREKVVALQTTALNEVQAALQAGAASSDDGSDDGSSSSAGN